MVPLGTEDHTEPFQCWVIVPPTAQTSLGPLPHSPMRLAVVLLMTADQAVPFQWTMLPASPTAQTSVGPLPHTALSPGAVPIAVDQTMPFQCSMMPWPTAHTSLGPL